MYSFMGIGTILKKLLSFKVIATLRYMKNKNKKKQKKQEPTSRSRIYDFD